ncbi:DUF2207 domain-containing protein [Jeotgalibacillus campisalis]|uniref:DUF2207 domain-containing protein n=1 Tax=Jeotgalibacillus campisalis TaxID=220754 RepID=A0A0C2RX98_9BACL|nr:DUF2207 domain-containing protein [Jeotgalibacillus campisalis]KIL46374.1 hypothetical protein KR50_30490 [Jeotgalibacillus campisalis]
MKVSKWIPLLIAVLFFMFPHKGHAVDYSISQSEILAEFQESGEVEVTETHTYDFDSEFNGITRQLAPKEGSAIENVKATESGKELDLSAENDLYRIYRSGDDEIIEVTITYTISNVIQSNGDLAEFYWAFFGDVNESDYENLSITLVPPSSTSDVIAFGYDRAFNKETIQDNGTVVYEYGKVPAETKGDIRAAWDAEIFSSSIVNTEEDLRAQLAAAEQSLEQEAATYNDRRDLIAMIGIPILVIYGLYLFFLIIRGLKRSKAVQKEAQNLTASKGALPPETLSLPALIAYMNSLLPNEAIGASLLNLVRKGNVIQRDESSYRIAHRIDVNEHEEILLDWLFGEIGSGEEFTLQELEKYTSETENHTEYQSSETRWKEAVHREVKDRQLFENKTKHRLAAGFSSLILLPLAVLFPLHGLFAEMFFTILLIIAAVVYAIAYSPRTVKGVQIRNEWIEAKRSYTNTSNQEWEKWSEDDKMRMYLYGLGSNDKDIIDKNDKLLSAFKPIPSAVSTAYSVDISTIAVLSAVAGPSFHSANESASIQSSSNSSASGAGGGGVGGGGGGSGAF